MSTAARKERKRLLNAARTSDTVSAGFTLGLLTFRHKPKFVTPVEDRAENQPRLNPLRPMDPPARSARARRRLAELANRREFDGGDAA